MEVIATKYKAVAKQKAILSYIKKSTRLAFVSKLLNPVLDEALNGTMLHIGRTTSQLVGVDEEWPLHKVVPLMGCFINDTMCADVFCGICRDPNRGMRNCRQCACKTKDFYSHLDSAGELFQTLRDAEVAKALNLRAQEIWFKKMQHGPSSITKTEEDVVVMAKSYCYDKIVTPLHDLFQFHMQYGIWDLFLASPGDRLHTMWKGMYNGLP